MFSKIGIVTGFLNVLFIFLSSTLQAQDSGDIKATILSQWMDEISNWDRWGPDDELGTLNLITDAKRKQAATLIRTGTSISLEFSISKEKSINNSDPLVHNLGTSGQWAGDSYTINYHGYAHSHIDALCHINKDGKLYNGYSIDGLKADGAEKLGIHNMKEGIISRGILVDIPELKGIPYMEPGTSVKVEDLEAWEKAKGIKISSGDVLLLRTGRHQYEAMNGLWNLNEKAAGFHSSVVKWFRERDIAAIGCDGVSDTLPSGVEGQTHPVHLLVLYGLGMPILDNLNLEDLAEEAQKQNRWEFFFIATPLNIEGGTGSPLNPIAMF